MNGLDVLRPPSRLDQSAESYKDWLHLSLFDHATGAVGLLNGSLHGSPSDPRSRAVGTALVHVPEVGWIGNVEVAGLSEAGVGSEGVRLSRLAIAVDRQAGTLLASARYADDGFTLTLSARPRTPLLLIEQRIPFGTGWISWYVAPRMAVEGRWSLAMREASLDSVSGYHDHNWGRWRWGDDVGWEWGAFVTLSPGPVFVWSRVTDRSHGRSGEPRLAVQLGRERFGFAGRSVESRFEGRLDSRLRRLPGALAALHQDRLRPHLPARLVVTADDGYNAVELCFEARAAAQLIAAEPTRRGYGFIHEMVGEFRYEGRVGGRRIAGRGLAVVEYVD